MTAHDPSPGYSRLSASQEYVPRARSPFMVVMLRFAGRVV
jgi:hypothetical protein